MEKVNKRNISRFCSSLLKLMTATLHCDGAHRSAAGRELGNVLKYLEAHWVQSPCGLSSGDSGWSTSSFVGGSANQREGLTWAHGVTCVVGNGSSWPGPSLGESVVWLEALRPGPGVDEGPGAFKRSLGKMWLESQRTAGQNGLN